MKTEENCFVKYHKVLTNAGLWDGNIVDLEKRWNESHRVYHNQAHLEEILSLIEESAFMYKPGEKEMLIICAFFHDAIYDPKSKTNEEDSAYLMRKTCKDFPHAMQVEEMILDTKDHTKPASSPLSDLFLSFDLNGLIHGDVTRMIDDERKILREFGFVDYGVYKNARGAIMRSFIPFILKRNPQSKIESYVNWFYGRTPKIALYVGTFFPFHKGHLDVLQRAERVFDKVVIVMGSNPAKNTDNAARKAHLEKLATKLPNNQIEFFEGLLHDYIKSLTYPVSIVKGLRNPSDFDSEKLQLRYMEDMYPEINVMYIVSDRKYEHISSSGIRQIQTMNPAEADKYLLT